MAAFLSTSCYGRKPLIEAIELCKKITPRNIEISAPHDYQPLEETAAILRKYKNIKWVYFIQEKDCGKYWKKVTKKTKQVFIQIYF